MNGITMDSTKVLKEKLLLARELATLKPELEHLRSQTEYQQAVLAEKLALQRQVSTLEVELETEKRALKRAVQKNNNEKEAELQGQLDELQKDLARCKRESEKARKEAERDFQTQVEELQKDLARVKRESEKSRKEGEKEFEKGLKRAAQKYDNSAREAELQHQVERLQKDLVREKKESERIREEAEKELENERRASKRATQSNENSERMAELHGQVEELKKDLIRGQKEAEKDLRASKTARTILESKLEQMRTKLRSTKDELKECQAELSQTRTGMGKGKSATKVDAAPKNPRKRGALEMSTDVTIGTPDGVAVRGKRPAVKKGRTDQTMVGEKSMFSITPFLNRTINTATDSPAQGGDSKIEDEKLETEQGIKMRPLPIQLAEASLAGIISSPIAIPKPRGKKKATEKTSVVDGNVHGESKASIQNTKLTAKKLRAMGTLEKVTEEEVDENGQPALSFVASSKAASENTSRSTDLKSSRVPKTIEAEEAGPKKKKRKLLGGGKTLFDEEDGEATKRPAKIALGPPRILGKGGLGGPKNGMKGELGAPTGFGAFSPLKKDRRGVGASFLA
jgi:hypothetical protein